MRLKHQDHQYYHYLILNKNRKIVYFNRSFYIAFFFLFQNRLILNSPIEQFIPQNLTINFQDYLVPSREETKNYISIADKNVDLEVNCTQVFRQKKLSLLVFQVRDIKAPKNSVILNEALNKYSFLTSHALRAPLSTILSLSNIFNNPQLESYNIVKIKELLANIQKQAEKLDEIIFTINALLISEGYRTKFTNRTISKEISTIVLVDDDIMVNKIHEHLIKLHYPNIQVTSFSAPCIALEYIFKSPPSLILLDINMPEIDGWDFLRAMDDERLPSEVIVLSSSISLNDKANAGHFKRVKFFIEKPLNRDKINSFLTS